MPSSPPHDVIDPELAAAVFETAESFPAWVRTRGRAELREGRVGPLRVEPGRVSASVRGAHTFLTSWRLRGHHADPICTCPATPMCTHAYALAEAIRERTAATAAAPAAVPRPLLEPVAAIDDAAGTRAEAIVAGDFAEWARQRAGMHPRSLRAALGLGVSTAAEPFVWLELRVTSPRLHDAPRNRIQIQQLAGELRDDPAILSPPHARLLRVVARTLNETHALRDARLALQPSALNRLLDSFADSPLITWQVQGSGPEATRGGIWPGGRLRLGDAPVDLVPVRARDSDDLRLTVAARWPDGRLRRLEEIVTLISDDDLNPSLVLEGGTFWRVAEAPPEHVIRRLARGGSLAVPAEGRERFITALASTFESAGDALGSHMVVHRARPVVTMDLGADDWLQVRLFAHTGARDWRPGSAAAGGTVFELAASGEWIKLDDGAATANQAGDLASFDPVAAVAVPAGEAAAADAAPAAETAPALAAAASAPGAAVAGSPDAGDGAEPAVPAEVWVEVPDPALLAPVRDWLATLPFARGGARLEKRLKREGVAADRGGWIHVTASRLHALGLAWEGRPPEASYLGNDRMRNLLAGRKLFRTRVNVHASGVDFLSISAEWEAEGLALTDADLARLRASSSRFVKLGTGWANRDWLEGLDAAAGALADLGVEVGAGEQRVTLVQLARASEASLAALEELGADPGTRAEIERVRTAVRGFAGVPRIAVPAALRGELRPYQRDGLDFLAFVTGLGMGAVLADDMGLGKTVQALAWIAWQRERDPAGGPALVVCPASVVHNWQREAARFTPDLRVLVLASGEERHALRREVPAHDLVITNYALLRRDVEHWRRIPLRAAILDEAQNIKNPKAAVSRVAYELVARHRLALTGTPIENRALDLWSIVQFVNPGALGPRAPFAERYDRPDAPAHVRRLLAARLRPMLLRRLKEQVAPELPDRIEERIECELTPGQRRLYLAELVRGREEVARLASDPGGLARGRIQVLALLTRLRQVCCHPALVRGRDDLGSGKFDALFELLEPLLAEGRKVLVFSQFVRLLELLGAEMKRRGVRHHVLTGATTHRERVVAAFESDPEPCAFLISLKAGGTGLNLTAAQYVVIFDPWWNPAVEAQAIDRTHRIGQTRTVIAYRLMAAGTVEEKIWELQQRKQALVSDVLGEDGFARSLTAADLRELLS